MVCICISLITIDVEYLFIYLLAVCLSRKNLLLKNSSLIFVGLRGKVDLFIPRTR